MVSSVQQQAHQAAPVRAPTAGTVLAGLAADPPSRVIFLVLLAITTAAYTVLLPFAFTQRLSLDNW